METNALLWIFVAGLSLTNANVLYGGRTNRILDGDIARQGDFPYAVSIQTGVPTDTRGHRCGGVLITFQHVVTVASCLYNINAVTGNSELINPSEYRVFAGAVSLADQSGDRVRSIANFTIHPGYTGMPALVNNIAIVTVTVPFLAGIVTPLPLPTNPDPVEFTLCTVAGWGGTNATNQASAQLRYFVKYVYSQKECTRVYNSIPGIKNILPSMICAVSHTLQSSNCVGDEGNALVCNNRLTGVLSLPDGCTQSTLPEVYTRISNYTTWIRSVSGSGSVYSANIFALIGFFSFMQIYFSM